MRMDLSVRAPVLVMVKLDAQPAPQAVSPENFTVKTGAGGGVLVAVGRGVGMGVNTGRKETSPATEVNSFHTQQPPAGASGAFTKK